MFLVFLSVAINMRIVLVGFSVIRFVQYRSETSLRLCCKSLRILSMLSLAVLRVPSSANKSHFTDLAERHGGKSLIKMPNRKGPRIDPWGTPHVIDVAWEYVPFTSTHCSRPRSGELRTQKLKSHLVRTQSLNVLPLKPGVDQYIAIHATLTARDFFLAYFYPSGPFTCIFPKPLAIFPVLAVASTWFLCRPAE